MYGLSEAEQVFHDDIRLKKKAASGVHSKTGRNGYVGNMRFPSDIMSRKDKYNYRRGSKVMISNMYEEIMPIEDFQQLERSEQKNRLAYWRNERSNKEIRTEMGIPNSRYYDLVKELDLPKAPRRPRINNENAAPAAKKREVKPEEQLPAKQEQPPVQEIIINGLHLAYNGTFEPQQIQKQLEKFSLILEDETDDFYIELKLMQKQKSKED